MLHATHFSANHRAVCGEEKVLIHRAVGVHCSALPQNRTSTTWASDYESITGVSLLYRFTSLDLPQIIDSQQFFQRSSDVDACNLRPLFLIHPNEATFRHKKQIMDDVLCPMSSVRCLRHACYHEQWQQRFEPLTCCAPIQPSMERTCQP